MRNLLGQTGHEVVGPAPGRLWYDFDLPMLGFRALLRLLVVSSCLLGVNLAAFAQTQSQPPSVANDRDPAAAETLFRTGRELLLATKYDEAFAAFEESYRLDPTAGALYNEAECRYKQGKVASAWALFQQAATLANVQGKPDQFDLATSRANLLQGELSYLTLHVAEPVPGLEVLRDGMLVGRAQFDLTLPVDPGRHRISARAPGFEPFEAAIIIEEKGDRKNVVIPKLKALAVPKPLTPTAPPVPQAPSVETNPNPLPWILGGAGSASLVVGGLMGILAIRENHEMNKACPAHFDCSPDVNAAQSRRDFESNVAWVMIPVGLATLGGAATWMALSQHSEHPSTGKNSSMRVNATASDHNVSVSLTGAF